jgi:hypothetical protein
MKETRPHHAQIHFVINIFPMGKSGEILPEKVSDSVLEDAGIKKNAVFNISGYSLEDCINNIREALRSIKYE